MEIGLHCAYSIENHCGDVGTVFFYLIPVMPAFVQVLVLGESRLRKTIGHWIGDLNSLPGPASSPTPSTGPDSHRCQAPFIRLPVLSPRDLSHRLDVHIEKPGYFLFLSSRAIHLGNPFMQLFSNQEPLLSERCSGKKNSSFVSLVTLWVHVSLLGGEGGFFISH